MNTSVTYVLVAALVSSALGRDCSAHVPDFSSLLQAHLQVVGTKVLVGGWAKVHEALKTEQLPPKTHAIFEQLAPEACACTIDRWDQYTVCQQATKTSTSAFSFGVMGYDPWGKYVNQNYNLIPELFDCFDHRKPGGFENNFAAVCLGAQEGELDGRMYETIPRLLKGVANASVLMKMDIEGSEFDVLGSLTPSDFERLSSLNVEYHFNQGRCPDSDEIDRALRVMQHVRKHLVVVDAAADYYGPECRVDGALFPKMFAVSYTARSTCPSP
eukprot:CAMPEP_0180473386 /NCGR_PEP_ID=MMETSP1036_2-20121128/30128_1 /TAXON_ID=632150 /ORGANISM="Azadinium spinosum, Strain 3D9" /LENGTH=270 /DNA_ID=CAMNT_0022480657 /DNA_START=48 /DNA_END=860 /DNA_ORIENTATION=-